MVELLNRIKKQLNSNGGYVFIIVILVILVLGTLGITLASSTVSNLLAHKKIQSIDEDFYGADGSMTYAQAILERISAYGRYQAQEASEQAYEFGLKSQLPLTNQEIQEIYQNSFRYYITNGRGKIYIDEQFSDMKTNPIYKTETIAQWSDLQYDSDGILISVNTKRQAGKQRIQAVFKLPYNYVQDQEREIVIIRDHPVPKGSMPIGFYNPLFRAALTTSSTLKLNGGANLYLDAKATTTIALQWPNSNRTPLLYTDARVDLFGTTVPILEGDATRTLQGNYSGKFYVNGVSVNRSIPCEKSNRFYLQTYFDDSYFNQIANNKSTDNQNYFEISEGDLLLRIYKGDVNNPGNEWKELSGKKGLIIVGGNINTNGGYNIDYFTGGMIVLGNGTSQLNSSIKIIHNEKNIKEAIDLYKNKVNGSELLNNVFRLNTLTEISYDPEAKEVAILSGGKLFDSPLSIGNQFVSNSGLINEDANPYFRIADKSIYLEDTSIGLQASKEQIKLVTQNNINFYVNGEKIWDKHSPSLQPAKNIGSLYSLMKADSMQSLKTANVTSVSRESANNQILKIFTGDTTINNGGKIGNEMISGKTGLIIVNGRLTIDGAFAFKGVVIATNGINAYNWGDAKIDYNRENAIDAVNLSTTAVELFDDGTNVVRKLSSVYDNVKPIPQVPAENLKILDSGIIISNVRFLPPYTRATTYGANAEIEIKNSELIIVNSPEDMGLRSTTDKILVAMNKDGHGYLQSDAVTTYKSGTYESLNVCEPISTLINLEKFKEWFEESENGPILIEKDDLVLGVYSDGQDYDLSDFDGKRGFLFYNGVLDIAKKRNFNFDGVIVATQGIFVKNRDVTITFSRQAAFDAIKLSQIATEIFMNDIDSLPGGETTYIGAPNAGTVNMYTRGVTIEKWNLVR